MERWAIISEGVIVNVVSPKPEVLGDGEATMKLEIGDNRWVGSVVDAKDIAYDRLDVVTHRIIFGLLNEVRALKVQQPLTAAQYKTFVKGQMG